ncbi:hypothetical protein RHECNPAF_9300166 [Rhizobium etli CNPAF512]|nr:hypothetical protein RHECNPAF_9300166 [Rhizobium etli CNPAF512]
MVAVIGRAAAIFQQQAFETAVIGLAHRGGDADIGGDAGQDDVCDALLVEDQFKVGGAEGTLARLVDDRFAFDRIEFGDDVPSGFAAGQDTPARTRIADPGADPLRAPAFVGRQVGKVGPMALARVDDVIALGAHGGQHAFDRLDRRLDERQVITHVIDIAALAAEIRLHVDDDEGRVLRSQIAVIRPGIGVRIDIMSFGFDHGVHRLLLLFARELECFTVAPRRLLEAAGRTVRDLHPILPRKVVFAGDEVVHVGIGRVTRAAGDSDIAAMAELVDIVFDTPAEPRFAHEIGTNFGGDDFVDTARCAVSNDRAVEIADHAFAHGIEGAVRAAHADARRNHEIAEGIRLIGEFPAFANRRGVACRADHYFRTLVGAFACHLREHTVMADDER